MKLAWYIHKGLVLPTKSITYPQIYQCWYANTNHGFTNIVLAPVYQKQYILINKIAELPKYQLQIHHLKQIDYELPWSNITAPR